VSATPRRLAVLVDGTPMEAKEALAFWERFSTWMEEHRGDLAGFATQEGFLSVHPGVDGDRPVLRASKSAAQQPYAPVARSGGSPARHSGPPGPDRRNANPQDLRGKPRK